jgi:hypothetical protein
MLLLLLLLLPMENVPYGSNLLIVLRCLIDIRKSKNQAVEGVVDRAVVVVVVEVAATKFCFAS